MARWLPRFRRPPPPAAEPAKAPPPPVPAAAAAAAAKKASYTPLSIESLAMTHQGCVRGHNEDSHVARDEDGLWAVADGMGGHEGGEWASARIVAALGRVALDGDFDAACAAAAEAVRDANGEILAEAKERGKQMGSTIVALIVHGTHYGILWVGDSRAYLLRGGALRQLSRDHSQVQEMVSRGLMKPEQAIGHPMGHILSRAVGVQEGVEVDLVTGEVQPGDVFLLCSDGLHGVVGDNEIAARLGRDAPDRALEQLVALTLANGAPDNVTGIAVWAGDPTLLSFADSDR